MRSFFGLSNNHSLSFTFFFSCESRDFHQRSEKIRHRRGRRFPQQPIKNNNHFGLLHEVPLLGTGQTPCINSSTALIRAAISEANSGETRADIALVYCSVALLSTIRLKKSRPPALSFGPTERPGTSSRGGLFGSKSDRYAAPVSSPFVLGQAPPSDVHPQSSFSAVLMPCQRLMMCLSPNDPTP